MSRFIKYCIFLLLLTVALPELSHAQLSGSAVRVTDGMVQVKIKQKRADYDHLMQYFGLNEDSLFTYHNLGKLADEGWKIKSITKRKAIIYKSVSDDNIDFQWGNMPLFFNFEGEGSSTPGYPGPVSYGVNSFSGRPTVFENAEDITVFYLPQQLSATDVFLSGNFNDWSTGQTPMQKTDSGWVTTIKLKPGKYFYKYIVDGKWIFDTNNNVRESDGNNSYNSTYFHTNYTFKLNGFTDKKQMILAGSFNNWNEKELAMQKTATGWELNLYLKEGTHTYKYIADREWMLDPGNPLARPDGKGNINSVMSLGEPHYFVLDGYLDAKIVMLTGSFNNWNAGELIMEKTATGWQIPFVLPSGNYEYKFIVDGQWITDPKNQCKSLLAENVNSCIVISANHLFSLNNFPQAKEVFITGSFCNWAEPGYKMMNDNGVWIFPCYLPAGKYTYKFVVDGKWILDPNNSNTEQNEYGTGNSVLWVSPDEEFLEK
ncbi:MAG: glycogen-binding domain-containing protein [Chitinophagales bacterium]|nr:glycogen-binding domain-containing protein [Bacteroidota bacterium]